MRYINMTEDIINQACQLVRTRLLNGHICADKIEVTVPTKLTIKPENKPSVFVTAIADRKMKALIAMCTGEVAWHGTVRYEADANTYVIEDIFVFPQEVSGATATATDDYDNGTWFMSLDDDTINKLRFHGHSHVNMGVSPSGVDIAFQEQLIDHVKDFYLFAIYNKRGDYEFWIYDMVNNCIYDKADIEYDTAPDIAEVWARAEVNKHVTEKKFVQTTFPITKSKYWEATWKTGYQWDYTTQGYMPNDDTLKKLQAAEAEEKKQAKADKNKNKKKSRTEKLYDELNRELHPELYGKEKKNADVGPMYHGKGIPNECKGHCVSCKLKCQFSAYAIVDDGYDIED